MNAHPVLATVTWVFGGFSLDLLGWALEITLLRPWLSREARAERPHCRTTRAVDGLMTRLGISAPPPAPGRRQRAEPAPAAPTPTAPRRSAPPRWTPDWSVS